MTIAASASIATPNAHEAAHEDALRAQVYRLLAMCTTAPLTADRLGVLSALEAGDATPVGKAISDLAHRAQVTTEVQAAEEYQNLFIGLARGELLPYGSYYLTGFLHEKPLARLRNDLAKFGIVRDEAVPEPEDHIAAVMDVMAGLIDGAFGEPVSLGEQKRFFRAHIGSWAHHFFRDLEAAKSANLYVGVARVGRAFLDIEAESLEMS